MGQAEVLRYLKEQRKLSDKWFSAKEIRGGLRSNGRSESSLTSIYDNLYKLTVYNIIQAKGIGLWKHTKLFRAFKGK